MRELKFCFQKFSKQNDSFFHAASFQIVAKSGEHWSGPVVCSSKRKEGDTHHVMWSTPLCVVYSCFTRSTPIYVDHTRWSGLDRLNLVSCWHIKWFGESGQTWGLANSASWLIFGMYVDVHVEWTARNKSPEMIYCSLHSTCLTD